MADNYLEKRMDDYERGRLSTTKHVGSSRRRAGVATIKYPPQTVYVDYDGSAKAATIVKSLVDTGNKVMFTAPDLRSGTLLAQTAGGRFYPLEPADIACDMAKRGERIDAVVGFNKIPRECFGVEKIIVFSENAPGDSGALWVMGGTDEAVATIAVMLCHESVKLDQQYIASISLA